MTGSKLLTATQLEKIAERIYKAMLKTGSLNIFKTRPKFILKLNYNSTQGGGKEALTKEILQYNNYQRQLIKDKYQSLYNQVNIFYGFHV